MSAERPVKLVELTGLHAGYEPDEDSEDEVEFLLYDARLHTYVAQVVRADGEFARVTLSFEANDKALRVRLRNAAFGPTAKPPTVTMIGGKANGKQWTFARSDGDDLFPEFTLEGLDAASFLHHASRTEKIRVKEQGGEERCAEFDAVRMTNTPVQPNIHHYMLLEQQKARSVALRQMSVPGRRFVNSAKWSFMMFFIRLMSPIARGMAALLTPLTGRLGCVAGTVVGLLILLGIALVLGDQIIDSFDAVVAFLRNPSWAILKPIGVGLLVVVPWFLWQVVRSDLWQDVWSGRSSRQRDDNE